MPTTTVQPALLVLADGSAYRGWSFGAAGTTVGEVVFNTGMTGYQEVLTDPSYTGQIVLFTYPELGNTGINPDDDESNHPQVRGAIARNITWRPSNWRSTRSLPEHLQQHHIPGIYGIDTRSITRKIRVEGAMNGGISTEILDPVELLAHVQAAPSMLGLNLVPNVTTAALYEWTETTAEPWTYTTPALATPSSSPSETPDETPVTPAIPTPNPNGEQPLTVVALDFGVKRNILRRLASYGCRVIVVPAHTPPEEILGYNPDGIFLSNGPGDPAAVPEAQTTVPSLLAAKKPIFGICLGHQILGQALGGKTFKLKFGHRGLNQPAGLSGQVEITSQNHSFALDGDSLDPQTVEITHYNLNDQTVAGLRHKTLPFFSVQYHPEASPGPHDADYLFEQFIQAMRDYRQQS